MLNSEDNIEDGGEILGFIEASFNSSEKKEDKDNLFLKYERKSHRAAYVNDASGLPFDYDSPQRRKNDLKPIGVVASGLLNGFGVPVECKESSIEEGILKVWDKIVGDDLRDKLTPEKYVNNILYLIARNNTELFEIRRFKLRSLEAEAKRHEVFAGLRQIRVRVATVKI